MNSLAQFDLASFSGWFDSPGHDAIGIIGLLVAAFLLYALIVNLHDIWRTIHIHFM